MNLSTVNRLSAIVAIVGLLVGAQAKLMGLEEELRTERDRRPKLERIVAQGRKESAEDGTTANRNREGEESTPPAH